MRRGLILLLLLAGCGTAPSPDPATPGETGISARIGGSAAGYYTLTR